MFQESTQFLAIASTLQEFSFLPSLIYRFNASPQVILHTHTHTHTHKWSPKFTQRDFPGRSVVKNPPANAGDKSQSLVRDDSISLGRAEPVLQSPGSTATEPKSCNYLGLNALEPMLHNKRSRHEEKPWQLASNPCLSQLQNILYSNKETAKPNE